MRAHPLGVLLFSFFSFSFVAAVAMAAGGADAEAFPANPTVLEISTRPWLYELSARYGRQITALRDIPAAEFAAIRAQGVDAVWFMGVWHLGPFGLSHDRNDSSMVEWFKKLLPDFTLEDVIGSPYAATNYTCNPALCPGGDADLIWLRTALRAAGLRLVLDFVPNHSACDSPWLLLGGGNDGADLYVRAPKGSGPPYDPAKYLADSGVAFGSCPGAAPWTDVAQLNYWNPDTRKLMAAQLARVASLADAVRCDMAYIVLNDAFASTWAEQLASWGWSRPADEFWPGAIKAARAAAPGVRFLAEVYGTDAMRTLVAEGFDWVYDKELLDRLRNGNLDSIRAWVAETTAAPLLGHAAHFVENHDEDRAVATLGSVRRADAAAAVSLTLPGLRLVFQGQRNGYANKLDVHLRRAWAESASPEAVAFYGKLESLLASAALGDGTWTSVALSGSDSWRFVGWRWAHAASGQKYLVVVNYSDGSASCNAVVPDVSGSGTVTITEVMSGATYQRSADEMRSTGLVVVIDAFAAQVFAYP